MLDAVWMMTKFEHRVYGPGNLLVSLSSCWMLILKGLVRGRKVADRQSCTCVIRLFLGLYVVGCCSVWVECGYVSLNCGVLHSVGWQVEVYQTEAGSWERGLVQKWLRKSDMGICLMETAERRRSCR